MKTLIALVGMATLAAAQAKPAQAHPKVDQAKVDAAIENGIKYLKSKMDEITRLGPDEREWNMELVLWTLMHADVPEGDAEFQKLLKLIH